MDCNLSSDNYQFIYLNAVFSCLYDEAWGLVSHSQHVNLSEVQVCKPEQQNKNQRYGELKSNITYVMHQELPICQDIYRSNFSS